MEHSLCIFFSGLPPDKHSAPKHFRNSKSYDRDRLVNLSQTVCQTFPRPLADCQEIINWQTVWKFLANCLGNVSQTVCQTFARLSQTICQKFLDSLPINNFPDNLLKVFQTVCQYFPRQSANIFQLTISFNKPVYLPTLISI